MHVCDERAFTHTCIRVILHRIIEIKLTKLMILPHLNTLYIYNESFDKWIYVVEIRHARIDTGFHALTISGPPCTAAATPSISFHPRKARGSCLCNNWSCSRHPWSISRSVSPSPEQSSRPPSFSSHLSAKIFHLVSAITFQCCRNCSSRVLLWKFRSDDFPRVFQPSFYRRAGKSLRHC